MGRTGHTSRKTRRLRLWQEDCRCRFCGRVTVLPEDNLGGDMTRHDLATIEHLDSRYNPLRGTFPAGEARTTPACWKCNNERNRLEQARVPIEVLMRRAHEGPSHRNGDEG